MGRMGQFCELVRVDPGGGRPLVRLAQLQAPRDEKREDGTRARGLETGRPRPRSAYIQTPPMRPPSVDRTEKELRVVRCLAVVGNHAPPTFRSWGIADRAGMLLVLFTPSRRRWRVCILALRGDHRATALAGRGRGGRAEAF